MNNSNNWYTQDNILMLFGKDAIKKLRHEAVKMKFSNRWLYSRDDVNVLLFDEYNADEVEVLLSQIEDYYIDLDEYVVLSEAIKIAQISCQHLYKLKYAGKVKTLLFDGLTLFCKDDLQPKRVGILQKIANNKK